MDAEPTLNIVSTEQAATAAAAERFLPRHHEPFTERVTPREYAKMTDGEKNDHHARVRCDLLRSGWITPAQNIQ